MTIERKKVPGNQTGKKIDKMEIKKDSEPYIHESDKDYFDEHNLSRDKTEVFDDVDMASNLAMGYAEQAWRKHREKMSIKVVHPDFDGTHCVECEIDIPALRIDMGSCRCTECQEMEDKRLARRR